MANLSRFRKLWLRNRQSISVALVLLACMGCNDGPPKYPVSGKVTLDGNRIPAGQIVFVPVDTGYDGDTGEIVDGAFSFRATAGKKKVMVLATRTPAGMDPATTTYRGE